MSVTADLFVKSPHVAGSQPLPLCIRFFFTFLSCKHWLAHTGLVDVPGHMHKAYTSHLAGIEKAFFPPDVCFLKLGICTENISVKGIYSN